MHLPKQRRRLSRSFFTQIMQYVSLHCPSKGQTNPCCAVPPYDGTVIELRIRLFFIADFDLQQYNRNCDNDLGLSPQIFFMMQSVCRTMILNILKSVTPNLSSWAIIFKLAKHMQTKSLHSLYSLLYEKTQKVKYQTLTSHPK